MSYHEALMEVMIPGMEYTTGQLADALLEGTEDPERRLRQVRSAVLHTLTIDAKYGIIEIVRRHAHGNTWRRIA